MSAPPNAKPAKALALDHQRSALSAVQESVLARQVGLQVILQLTEGYDVSSETSARAILLYDSVLFLTLEAKTELRPDEFASHAIACFMLSTKLYEVSSPCISDLVRLRNPHCSSLTETQIVQSEVDVISMLDWNINFETGIQMICYPVCCFPAFSYFCASLFIFCHHMLYNSITMIPKAMFESAFDCVHERLKEDRFLNMKQPVPTHAIHRYILSCYADPNLLRYSSDEIAAVAIACTLDRRDPRLAVTAISSTS
jgi:hypothetical protein